MPSIPNEKETRSRLFKIAREMGFEKELTDLFTQFDKNLSKPNLTFQERDMLIRMALAEIDKLVSSSAARSGATPDNGAKLFMNKKLIINK